MSNSKPDSQLRLDPPRVGLNLWLRWHMQGLIAALGRLTRAPVASLMTACVIGIALALPGAMFLLLENMAAVGGQFDGSKRLSVFLQADMEQQRVHKISAELQIRPEVARLTEVSPKMAVGEYLAMGGSQAALQSLGGDNPFPWMLELELVPAAAQPEQISHLVDELRQHPAIDDVIYDRVWLERLFALMDLGLYVVVIVAVMLGFGVLLVIGNTIRLEIGGRQSEIEILQLFGGTDAFVRRPFLWTGVWYGSIGGLIAVIVLIVEVELLRTPVAELAATYASNFELIGLGPALGGALFTSGALLGLAGSWLSVSRYLSTRLRDDFA